MKYFSAFSGIGGFDLAINRIIPNAICVGYSEVDKYAIKVYEKRFPNRICFGDITRIDTKTLPDFDVFFGGFPCQDISLAGKRAGLYGSRSGLFFEIIRIIREKQPSIILLENVKGLLSSNGGWDFARVLIELDECGYDVEWQCLNSKNFGVPQNRERLFIIGHLRGKPWERIFPIKEIRNTNSKRVKGESNTFLKLKKIFNIYGHGQCGIVYDIRGISPTICCTGKRLISINNKIRKLTPLESERLQGYPDNWTECISKTERYKCLEMQLQ